MENGTVTLIGATTENPYFEVNKRWSAAPGCFVAATGARGSQRLLQRALADEERGYGDRSIAISNEATNLLWMWRQERPQRQCP